MKLTTTFPSEESTVFSKFRKCKTKFSCRLAAGDLMIADPSVVGALRMRVVGLRGDEKIPLGATWSPS